MKQLSVLLVGSALALSAHAVNWLEVSNIDSGSSFRLDLDSIERSDITVIDEYRGEYISVSIHKTYPVNKKYKGESGIYSSDQQLLISCRNTSYYRRAYVNHDANDNVVESWQSKKPILTIADFDATSPKTVGRTIVDKTCNYYAKNR